MKPPKFLLIALPLAMLVGAAILLQDRSTINAIPDTAAGTTSAGSAPAGASADTRDRDVDDRSDNAPRIGSARVFRCSIEDFQQPSEETDEEQIERFQQRHIWITNTLASSADLEHRLTAGILKVSRSLPDAIDDFEDLLVTMPDHPVLHWRLLDACTARPTYPLCESGNAERRVINTLGSNGEAWAKIAHYRIKRGDDSGGLQALRNAAVAAEFQNYWGIETALLFRGLAVDSNKAIPERIIEAVGHSVTFPMPELELIKQCRSRAGQSVEWQQACLAYGERKESASQTLLGRGIGSGLKSAMMVAAGEPEDEAGKEARDQRLLGLLRDPVMQDGEVLLAFDENIGLSWLQRLATYGEFTARDFLKSEVARVSQIPGYDPCPVNEPEM